MSTETQQHIPAPRLLRLANVLIDMIAMIVLMTVCLLLLTIFGYEHVADYILELHDLIITPLLYLLYYLPLEAATGKSIGKYLTKTRVVSTSSHELDLYQAAGRTLARLIPFEPLSIFSVTRRCWHDSLANTVVIVDKNEKPTT